MSGRVRKPLLGCLACVLGLLAVALLAFKVGAGERFDARLLEHLTVEPGSAAFKLTNAIAHLADPVPLLLMLIGVCALGLRWGRRREALAAIVVVAGANVTTQVLKMAFSHERFWTFLGENQPWSNAFPSGHTTAAASIAVAAVLVAPPRMRGVMALLGGAFAAAVGLSVVVLEWHYPSDVAGGLLVAAGWGFAALAALRFLGPEQPRPQKAQTSRPLAISVK